MEGQDPLFEGFLELPGPASFAELAGRLVTLGDGYLVLERGRLGSSAFVVVPFTVSRAG